jgi:hypothetical protein
MGIRIHKVLGYGLERVKRGAGGEWNDLRINSKSKLFKYGKSDKTQPFYDFLDAKAQNGDHDAKMELILLKNAEAHEQKKSYPHIPIPHETLSYQVESSRVSPLVITPLLHVNEWKRSDDSIDYYQNFVTNPKTGMRDTVKLIHAGIYPYEGRYIDSRDGHLIDHEYKMVWQFLSEDKNSVEESKRAEVRSETAIKMGFASSEEVDLYMKPSVPQSIINLAECYELFTNPLTVYQLEPMIYTWWG